MPESGLEPGTTFTTGDNPFSVVATDLNGDAWTDLVVSSAGEGSLVGYAGDGRGNFERRSIEEVVGAQRLGTVAAGDFDEDQRPDIVVVERGTIGQAGTLHILLAERP